MGRINRRIYSRRRKRSSAFKLRFANPEGMNSELINQLGQAQASGDFSQQGIRKYKYMVNNATPPYISDATGEETFDDEKNTYKITKLKA